MNSIVLDTNVLMENHEFLDNCLNDYDIIIPVVVIEELDNLKQGRDLIKARKAKNAIKSIDKYRDKINFNSSSYIHFSLDDSNVSLSSRNDNIIVSCAFKQEAKIVTLDLNVKVKAAIIGVECIDIAVKKDIYKGYVEYYFNTEEYNSFYENREKYFDEFNINQYIIIHNTDDNVVTEYRFDGNDLIRLKLPSSKVIKGENALQRCALDMLYNPDIEICAVLGGYGCVDADTEYFNGKQWKKISEYDGKDLVLEYDSETGKSLLSKPIEYIKLVELAMHSITAGKTVSQEVSIEHEIAYLDSEGKYNKMEFTKFKDLVETNKGAISLIIPKNFITYGTGVDFTDDELKIFTLCFCAERYDHVFKGHQITVNTCELKQEIIDLFERNNISYKLKQKKKNDYVFYFRILRRLNTFKKEWYNCSSEQLNLIVNHIFYWKVKKFVTHRKDEADFLQFAFNASGQNAIIDEISRVHKVYGVDVRLRKPEYTLNIVNSEERELEFTIKRHFCYYGYKYCFKMPTGNLILRNNNRIFITGNSGKTFLSLRMGLEAIKTGKQSKILGIREPVGEGKEVGYLKGDFDDKTVKFFLPLVHSLEEGEFGLQRMIDSGEFESSIPYFLKGTTYNSTVIICDEAEDLSERQIRLIGTRLGKESRIFFAGDYKQGIFDATHANPLVKMCEELKGNPKFGCIFLGEDVRSEASKVFANLYKN